MADCEECSKKIGILGGYRHPALGAKFLVCGTCFGKVNGDMQRWDAFCQSDIFDAESSKVDIQNAWNKKISYDHPLQNWFTDLWIKIGSQPYKN